MSTVTNMYSQDELSFKFLYKNLTSAIDLTTALNISYNQLYILLILALDDSKKFYEFYGSKLGNKGFMDVLREELDDLVDKGYLAGRWFGTQQFPETTQIEPKLKEYMFKMFATNTTACKSTMQRERKIEALYMGWAQEFVNTYPSQGFFSDGTKATLKGCKHPGLEVNNIDQFKKRYIAEIERSETLHDAIIDAIKKYKDGRNHASLNMGMVNFVVSHAWTDLISGIAEESYMGNSRSI